MFTIEIIDSSATTKEELCNLEKFYIKYYKELGFILYNLTDGGDGVIGRNHTESDKEKIRLSSIDRIWVTDGEINKFIKIEELADFLNKNPTFSLGHHIHKEIDIEQKSKKISENNSNRVRYTNGKEDIFVKKILIQEYEKIGFYPGSLTSKRDWVWMNNGLDDFKIKKEDCFNYWNNGYKYGRITFGTTKEGKKSFHDKMIGRSHSIYADTGEKISKSKLGHSVSQEIRDKISTSLIGHKASQETRAKLSQSLKSHIVSEETREKIANSQIGINNSMYGKHPIKIQVCKDNIRKIIGIRNTQKYLDLGYEITTENSLNIYKKWLEDGEIYK